MKYKARTDFSPQCRRKLIGNAMRRRSYCERKKLLNTVAIMLSKINAGIDNEKKKRGGEASSSELKFEFLEL